MNLISFITCQLTSDRIKNWEKSKDTKIQLVKGFILVLPLAGTMSFMFKLSESGKYILSVTLAVSGITLFG